MLVSYFNDMEKEYLYLMLGIAGLVIALLIATVVYYRRRLMICKTSLIRHINENIEMKQKLPEYELPRFIGRDELTAEEFASIIHNMLKRLMFVATFILAFIPTHAQQNGPTDSVYTFRFIYGSDMFYVPTFGNDKEFARLEECIETYRPEIHSSLVPLCVDGYCNSAKTENKRPTYDTETARLAPVSDPVFSIRANLLRWATLTPDLGVEWRINKGWSLLVNGSWTSWSWDDKNRRYALWEVSPEVRHYIGKEKRGYVGAMYKVGEFNYKLGETGKQGDLIGGGITGGYQLRLNKALSMDFSFGLGYMNADVENYKVTEGVRVRQEKDTRHWFGPVQAGVTLVWRLVE